jgi:hypothetical protein
MATKRLARTAIEGGRTGYSKYQRRHSHRYERTYVRCELSKIVNGSCDDVVLDRRDPVYVSFADKLGPAKRWLERQVGRPWDEVYASLKQAFDPRTTAGRHLVYDHMLPWVFGSWAREFEVDAEGILRTGTRRERWRNVGHLRYRERDNALRFMGSRKVGERGSVAFWFVPVIRNEPVALYYRQDRRLSDEEAKTWWAFDPEVRKELRYLETGNALPSAPSTKVVRPLDKRLIEVRFLGGGLWAKAKSRAGGLWNRH